jgi:ribosomal protein L31
MAKIHPKRRWQATVTDQSTGDRYKVRGCACTIRGCFCDAVVTATQRFMGTLH